MYVAYFERRIPTNIHKKHIVPFHHVLKHLLAGKGSDGWSDGIKNKQTKKHRQEYLNLTEYNSDV